MQSNQMQALSGKELEYIADSISNEDLLIKQLAATAGTTQNSAVQGSASSRFRVIPITWICWSSCSISISSTHHHSRNNRTHKL